MLKRISFILILTLVGGAMAGAQDLPQGKALMAKYIEALGGEAALKAVESMTETGTLTLSDMGMEAKYTAYTQPPNHVDYSDFEGMGVVRNGVTDGVVWSINPFMGNDARKTGAKARVISFLDWEKQFTSAECVGEEAIGAKACYKINLTRSEGNPTTVYLDKESGLMIKKETTSGDRVQWETYSQYKQVGDIMHPHKFDSAGGPIALSIMLDSVEINVEIPPEKLQFPDEIQATLEGQGSQ